MPAYAYAIKVNYDREMVHQKHTATISPPLTVNKLATIVGDASFSVVDEDTRFSQDYVVSWTTKRPETDKEMAARIAKDERYNRNRDAFQAKHHIP